MGGRVAGSRPMKYKPQSLRVERQAPDVILLVDQDDNIISRASTDRTDERLILDSYNEQVALTSQRRWGAQILWLLGFTKENF